MPFKFGDLGRVFLMLLPRGRFNYKILGDFLFGSQRRTGPKTMAQFLLRSIRLRGKNGRGLCGAASSRPVMSYEHDSVPKPAVAGGGPADDAELIVFKLGNAPKKGYKKGTFAFKM
ncbi:MAG: hypothetical protein Ct9H90mP25_5850 [Gammaproteobacteria bacterium]|nr:MAG: hypothetical protein Ct9H90mP25_5850 [Gammaproteobacteria bacterium]